jgi:hypothetical protein
LGVLGQHESACEIAGIIPDTFSVGALMKTTSQRSKANTALPQFIQKGLRVHREATRNVCAEERRMGIKRDPTIIAAIRKKLLLKFVYNGEERIVEPQTYGLSTTGKEILRAYQKSGGSRSGQSRIAKLFDVAKISNLQMTNETFAQALSAHNPDDCAMIEIFATLPRPLK